MIGKKIRKSIRAIDSTYEGLHRQMRKVTKNRSMFPSDDALFKILYLVTQDISKKWQTPKWRWGEIISQLSIHFEGRIKIDLI